MKATLRLPLEQYAFAEIEIEVENIGEAKDKYDELKREFLVGDGLNDKEWRNALDGYISTATMESETYANMNAQQKQVIQELKKSFKRTLNIK